MEAGDMTVATKAFSFRLVMPQDASRANGGSVSTEGSGSNEISGSNGGSDSNEDSSSPDDSPGRLVFTVEFYRDREPEWVAELPIYSEYLEYSVRASDPNNPGRMTSYRRLALPQNDPRRTIEFINRSE